MNEEQLTALGALAFSAECDPTALWRASRIVRNSHPEEAAALAEYAATYADILDLPLYGGELNV